MTELTDRALMRVFRGQEPIGVGFLVSDDLALTCAHVVASALNVSDPEIGATVEIDFPVLDSGTIRTARVVHVTGADGPDVVGLRPDSVPEQARAVRVVAAEHVRDHRVRAFGVPDRRPNGVWTEGIVRGPIAGGRIHVEDDRDHGLPMLRGFSGSPLIDDELSAVIGMVVEVERKREHRIGYALSGTVLHETWPELAAAAAQPSPFRGLEPFQENDSEYFFGRERRTTELVEQLERDGVVVVTGPSGCGKSSLVLAGMHPALTDDRSAVAVCRPATGGTPWTALAAALAEPEAELHAIDEVAGLLAAGRAEDVLNRVLVRRDLRRLVVVIDQLDEALARAEEESTALLEALLDVVNANRRTPRIDLVITISGEPLGELLADPRFGHRLSSRTATLGTPGATELREVVERPLAPAGMPVLEDGLADALLADVAQERNPLPLLEFTLTLLWERQDRGVLTHEAYRSLGGVAGAVSNYAEQVWDRGEGDDIRRLLSQLVSPVERGGCVRRVVPLDRLGPLADTAKELARTRLVTLGTTPDGAPTVELVHEALIRHWARLRGWVEEDHDFRLWQDEVDRSAARWRDRRERDLLLRGSSLRVATEMLSQRDADPSPEQREFINASVLGWLRRWVIRSVVTSLVISLVAGLTFVVVRFLGQESDVKADNAADALIQRSRASTSLAGDGPLMTARAFRTADRMDTRRELRAWSRGLRFAETVIHHADRDRGVTKVNREGSRAVVMNDHNSLTLWDFTVSPPSSVDLPPDRVTAWLGRDLLITGRAPNTVTIWNARTGQPVRTVEMPTGLLAADPNGRWIASAAVNSADLHLLDTSSPDAVPQKVTAPGVFAYPRQSPEEAALLVDVLPSGEAYVTQGGKSLAMSASGTRVLSTPFGGDEGLGRDEPVTQQCAGADLVLRGAVSGTEFARATAPAARCSTGRFSSDGKIVAFDEQGEMRQPMLTVGPVDGSTRPRAVIVPADYRVDHVRIDANGDYSLLLRADESILVLRVPRGDEMDAALADGIEALSTADGKHVVVVFEGNRVEVWQRDSRQRVGVIPADRREQFSTIEHTHAMSPDGRTLAIRAPDELSVRLWRLPDLTPMGEVRPPPVAGKAVAIPRFLDGDRLLVRMDDEMTVWNVGSRTQIGKKIRAYAPDPKSYSQTVQVVAVGTDEVLVRTADKTVRRYRVSTGEEVPGSQFTYGEPNTSHAEVTAIDEDGELVALVDDRAVEVWDLAEHEQLASLTLPDRVTASALRFRSDSDELEITLNSEYSDNQATDIDGELVQLWTRDLFWGLPRLLGRSDEKLEVLPDVLPAPAFVNAGQFESGGVESADPRDWLNAVCRVMKQSKIERETADPPDGAWTGAVCTS